MQATLLFLFFIGMLGDSFTTFLGIVAALGTQLGNPDDIGNYAFAAMGTSVITGLNLFTLDVFERKNKTILKIYFSFPCI